MIRVDGFEWVDLGYDGGPYDQWINPKLVWHTTEGATLAGAEAAFGSYPPHLGVDPNSGERHQYVSLDRHAAALAGSANEQDTVVIQLEVVGYADHTGSWSTEVLQWLADHVAAPALRAGFPPVVAPQGFHGAGEGIVLASPNSPIRFSLAGWNAFSGHVGHQHAPAPDEHWDPGALDVPRILELAGGAHLQPEDDEMPYYLFTKDQDGGQWWLTDMLTNTRVCDSLDDALNVDWLLRNVGGKPGLVCNRAANDLVAGPIGVQDWWLDEITRHRATTQAER